MYQSNILDDLPTGLTGPTCYSADHRSENETWIWLEELQDDSHWSLSHFANAAKLLGRFNGQYLAGKPYPNKPWLTQNGSTRGTLQHFQWVKDAINNPAIWKHAIIRSAFPVPVLDRLNKLWDDSVALLNRIEAFPQTFCHLDAFRRNMFNVTGRFGDGSLALIDWSYAGKGIMGTDASDLASASFGMFDITSVEPKEFFDTVFENYISGLNDVGLQGDRQEFRFAFNILSALKYGCMLLWLPDIANEEKYTLWERISSHSMEDYVHNQAILIYHLLNLADDARRMIGQF